MTTSAPAFRRIAFLINITDSYIGRPFDLHVRSMSMSPYINIIKTITRSLIIDMFVNETPTEIICNKLVKRVTVMFRL